MAMFHVTAVSTAVTILVAPFFIAVAALLYAFAVRRLLGLRLGGLRTLIAGVLAFLVASPIITALFGNNSTKQSGILPGLWFFMLGTAIALLAGMTFLVIAEAFVPSGSIPGPLMIWRQRQSRSWRASTSRSPVNSLGPIAEMGRPSRRPITRTRLVDIDSTGTCAQESLRGGQRLRPPMSCCALRYASRAPREVHRETRGPDRLHPPIDPSSDRGDQRGSRGWRDLIRPRQGPQGGRP